MDGIETETPQENSSHSTDVKPAESSPAAGTTGAQAENAASAPAGEREAFMERVAKLEGREAKPAEEHKTEDEPEEEVESPAAEAEEKPEGAEAEPPKKDEPGEKAEKPADDPNKEADLSQSERAFNERPEWRKLREVTGENFKQVRPVIRQMMEREQGLRQQVDKLKAADQVVTRLRTATKGDQGLQDAVALIERFDVDPAKAVPMLEQLLEDARKRSGLEVVSNDLKPDLQKLNQQLEDGLIDQAEFDKQKGRLLEVEKARAKANAADAKLKATEQTEINRRTEAMVRDRQTALSERERLVWSKDPDFPRIKNLFLDRATKMVEQATEKKGSMLSKDEMVAEADAAWLAIKKEVGALIPKPKPSRAVVSTGSSRTAVGQPKSDFEEFQARVRSKEGG